MGNAQKNIVLTVNWAAAIGSIVGLAGFVFPGFRQALEDRPLWGWIGFLLLLVLCPFLLKLQLGALINTSHKAKDLALLRERMSGWDLDSDFYEYLMDYVSHSHLPLKFVQQLEDQIRKWERDDRSVHDKALNAVWEETRRAALAYSDKIHEYMWLEDRVRDQKTQYMEVPPEWKGTDPQRSADAYKELGETRAQLDTALRSMLRVLHDASLVKI